MPRIAIASGHGELSSGGGKTDLDDMGDLLGADAFAVDTLLIPMTEKLQFRGY